MMQPGKGDDQVKMSSVIPHAHSNYLPIEAPDLQDTKIGAHL